MSDQGFTVGGDDTIDLNLGTDEVPLSEFTPAPPGVYKLLLAEVPTVQPTQKHEQQLVFKFTIVGPGSTGKTVRETAIIPGAFRREEKDKNGKNKWATMMGMFRDRLEALTQQQWRDDNMKLNLTQLSGHSIIAELGIRHAEWEKEGESKSGDFNEIVGFWRTDDGSLDAKIREWELQNSNGSAPSTPAAASSGATSSPFQI